jgi:hypothetical protein
MLTTRAQHGESRRAISEPVPGVVQGASKVVPAPARVVAGNPLDRAILRVRNRQEAEQLTAEVRTELLERHNRAFADYLLLRGQI